MSSHSSLGTYLRRRRECSGLSVEAISTGSRIAPRLIDALEADRHDLLPAAVYVRGFIRAYCDQVGVDAESASACTRRRQSRSLR
jgi:cytoskeletal protein RodZ